MRLCCTSSFTSSARILLNGGARHSAAPQVISICGHRLHSRPIIMENKASNKRLISIFSDGFLILYFLFALFPIFWMVLISLKSTNELFSTQFIFTPTLDNYQAIIFGDTRASAGVIA